MKIRRGDFFGGITAGVVALPLALAFGVHSGLGAAAGLYGAIVLGFFAAVFGGTPSQISGPTGPMTVVSTATIASFVAIAGNVDDALGAIVACFVLTGLLQIVMGVVKIGTLIKYIPYPVISGFMSGIGVIIILLQFFSAVGLSSPGSPIEVVGELSALANFNAWALLYAALSIAIIYLFPKITKAVPGTLVALIAVTLLSVWLDKPVPVIGEIPKGLPDIQLGAIASIPADLYTVILTSALTLAALGSIDSLLTSVVADNVTKTKHNSNRELIGQGIGNAAAGLVAGLPGAGATMRTLVNIRSGGSGRLSGVIHAITLLVILLGVGRYAAVIPNAVLAGILITVGIGILDYKGLKHLRKIPRSDAVIMILVLLATVFLDLLTAVGIGMVLAALLFMKKMSDLAEKKTEVKPLSPGEFSGAENKYDGVPQGLQQSVYVKKIEGPLFFGFASGFQRMMEKLPDISYVVIRMERVPFIDQTGLYALEEAVLALERRNIQVLLVGLQEQPEGMLTRIHIIPDLIDKEHVFANYSECLQWLLLNAPTARDSPHPVVS